MLYPKKNVIYVSYFSTLRRDSQQITHLIVSLKNSVSTHKVSATNMATAYALKQKKQRLLTFNLHAKACTSGPIFM